MDGRYKTVFKPGTYPEKTYVSRKEKILGYTYEDRLLQSLSIEGYLTYIVGASKCGKTVLCEKVIGAERMVSMSGNDFTKISDFWQGVGKKIGFEMSSSFSDKTEDYNDKSKEASIITKNYINNKDKIIKYFIENNKILVLDDFHYAPADIQYEIACQLKEAIRLGFQSVIISLPHRCDDAIRLNPDLAGRLSVIEIDAWGNDDLCEIARKGFKELNKKVKPEIMERIAVESICSPQLMQAICLNIGLLPDTTEKTIINEKIVESACYLASVNLPYVDVVRFFKAGPPSRGQKRLGYILKDNTERDIYDLLLKAIADNPPLIEIGITDLTNRVRNIMADANKINNTKVKSALKNWMKILETQGSSLYNVIEWKDESVHILDNHFLFYMRWKKDE